MKIRKKRLKDILKGENEKVDKLHVKSTNKSKTRENEPNIKDKRSQTSEILNHLQKYGSITSLEAFELYGATRLSSIIFVLRKKYKIDTTMLDGKTRYGTYVSYAQYEYEGEL